MTDQRPNAGRRLQVLLVGNYPADGQHSMLRYVSELSEGLASASCDVSILQPPVFAGRLALGRPSLLKWLGYIDKFLIFGLRLGLTKRRDLVHIIDQGNAFYRFWFRHSPVAVTCHDLFAVRSMLGDMGGQQPRASGRLLQRMILKGLKATRAFLCVSEESAADLRRLVDPPLIRVVPNAVREELKPMERERAHALAARAGMSDAPFFLHVGGNGFYKNRVGAVAIFDRLADKPAFAKLRLVLAGRTPDAELAAAIQNAKNRDRIDIVDGPDDETIQALYSRADALLFPSLHEGFGWPIVEAQACGCPVITSDREPMRTVAGGAAILIDPSDPAVAADRIEDMLPEMEALRRLGLANAAQYRMEQIAGRVMEFYHEAIAEHVLRQRQGTEVEP